MTGLQSSIHAFYNQFCLAYPNSVLVDEDTVFPYITYDYQSSESMTSSLGTFQIWDNADHILRINEIANRLEKGIPAIVGTTIVVMEGMVHEWWDPTLEEWHEFDLKDFSQIVKDFYVEHKGKFKQRQSGGKSVGALKIMRSTPFIQTIPTNQEEKELRRYMGNVEIKHYLC